MMSQASDVDSRFLGRRDAGPGDEFDWTVVSSFGLIGVASHRLPFFRLWRGSDAPSEGRAWRLAASIGLDAPMGGSIGGCWSDGLVSSSSCKAVGTGPVSGGTATASISATWNRSR